MTEDERLLRNAIDKARRERVAVTVGGRKVSLCSGCGCEWANKTLGCTTCIDRHRGRTRA